MNCISHNVWHKIALTTCILLLFTEMSQAQLSYENCNCGANMDLGYFAIKHYHNIKNHVQFSVKTFKDKICCTTELPDSIEVVSDGTPSSILEIDGQNFECGGMVIGNVFIYDENFEVVDTSATDEYGSFKVLAQSGRYLTLRFKHPKKWPPDGTPFGTYVVGFRRSDGSYLTNLIIKYYRPPVVMVHGLWSDNSAFTTMESSLVSSGNYELKQLHKADYKSTNAASFNTNKKVIPNAIIQGIINGPSCGKVDLVLHSMGGILTRYYLQNPTYTNNKDIRRVVTCNTPHAGSQMANWLLDPSQYGSSIASVLGMMGMSSNNGAVSDLRVGQPVINGVAYGAINGDAKVHAIQTEQGISPNPLPISPYSIVASSLILSQFIVSCGAGFLSDMFDFDTHDLIVARQSQKGGLSSNATTTIGNQQHSGSVGNSEVIDKVNELLNEPSNSTMFASSYTGFSLNYSINVPCLPFREDQEDVAFRGVNPEVEITAPSTGTSIEGGSVLMLSYTATGCDSVACLIRVHPDSILIKANSASAGTLQVELPDNLYGTKTVVLLGVDEDNKILDSDSITIHFTTDANLDSLAFYPSNMYLSQGDSSQFSIQGYFDDGIVRDLTEDPLLDFEFQQMNASLHGGLFIRLDNYAMDKLVVKKGLVQSDTVQIIPVGINMTPGCNTVTSTANDGPGSLRYALNCVFNHDTVYFAPHIAGDTILLSDTEYFYIDRPVVLLNTHSQPVTIRSSKDFVLAVVADTDVELKNIHIQSASPEKKCLLNFGNLKLENCQFYTNSMEKGIVENFNQGQIQLKGNNTLK